MMMLLLIITINLIMINSFKPIIYKKNYLTRLYNENETKAWQMAEPKTARERASFSNKIPFSEDMYKVIKKAIEILSKRSTDKTPITKAEAQWFTDAIDIIIDDAKKYGPPPKPVKRSADNTEE